MPDRISHPHPTLKGEALGHRAHPRGHFTPATPLATLLASTALISSSLLSALLLSACSTHSDARSNYFLAETSIALLFAYSGETFVPSPEFRVFNLVSPLTAYTDFTDSVRLTAYSDSTCKTAAPGTLTAATNPMPFTSGVSSFPTTSYTLANGAEGLIYLSGTIASDNFSTCGLSHSIIQHFNKGTGFTHFGAPGAAAGTTSATVADTAVVQRITPTGSYLVAGTSKDALGGTRLALWQYLPTGALDTTFNTVGYLTAGGTGVAGASGANQVDTPVDLQIDSSGKTVLVGTSKNPTGGTELAVWRLNTDGTLDTTFGTGGKFHTGSPGLTGRTPASAVKDLPKAMTLDSNGNLLITGTSQNLLNGYEMFVARITSLGALDLTFATNGVYHFGTTGLGGASNAAALDVGNGIKISANGSSVIVGSTSSSGGGNSLAIWKLNSTGSSLDSSFGSNGNGTVTYGTTGVALGTGANLSDVGKSLLIDSSDRIVIVGSSRNPAGGTEMAMWRYLSAGTLDTGFASSGALHFSSTAGTAGATGASENDVANSLVVDTRYSFYIAAGTSTNASGGTQAALWRYSLNGTLDPTFNSIGSAATPSTGATGLMTATTVRDQANAIQLDAYSTYIVVGSSLNSSGGTELAIWRYLIIGIPDV